MKELLKKAFEAGKDKQYDIEWQMGRSKPDFEEWYKEHENEVLDLFSVVVQSEQLVCDCGNKLTDKEIYFGQCLQCDKSIEEEN